MTVTEKDICRIVRDSDNKPVKFSFDAHKLTVTPARALKKGKFSNVRYNGGSLYIETPWLHLPMGVSSFEDDGKKSLFVSCRGHEDQDDVRLFVEALEALQERVVDQAASLKLVGEKSSRELVSDLMTPIIKTSDKYPPAFRVALPQQDGKYMFDAFTTEGKNPEVCDIDNMDLRNARAKIILTINSVWVVNNKNWGVSLKTTQLMVKPNFDIKSMGVSCFADDVIGNDDDDDAIGFDQAASDNE